MTYRKKCIRVPGYSYTVNIADVFAACQIVSKSETPPDYLSKSSVMSFIRSFADEQRSWLDDNYY